MIKNNQITKKTHGLEARRQVFLAVAIISIVLFSVNFASSTTTVTLNSPANGFNNTFPQVTFNCSASDDSTFLTNISLWTNLTGSFKNNINLTIYNYTDSTNLSAAPKETLAKSFNFNDYTIFNKIYVMGQRPLGAYSNLYIEVYYRNGTTSNETHEMIYPYTLHIITNKLPATDVRNITVKATSSPGTGAMILGDLSIETVTIKTNSSISNNELIASSNYLNLFNGNNNIKEIVFPDVYIREKEIWNCEYCSNNSNCSFAASNYSINYNSLVNSINYNSSSTNTKIESFILNISTYGYIPSSAYLVYNGNNYSTSLSYSGGHTILSNSFSIPNGINGSIPFYWVINSSSTTSLNTPTYYQTVQNLSIYECTGVAPYGLTLNFTLYDEATKLKLNGSFESSFNYFVIGGTGSTLKTFNFQSINQNKSNWMFCLNSSENVSFSGTASYYADYYDRREYIFSNATVGNFTQNIPLYLSLIADTDVVTVTVQDQNYNPISGALVYIQEWNVGTNTYSTIGMFNTDSNGNGIINLELYNKWYRAVVSIDGEIVKTTDVQKLADTTWFINVELATANPYELFDSISHGLTFDNETNITTFVWTDGSGYIQSGCLYIYNNTNTGYSLIHSECVSSVAGIINYLLPGDGDYQVVGTIYLTPDYNVSKVIDVLFVQIGVPELTRIVSPFGKILTFLFVGVATFLGVSVGSPIWGSMLLIGSLFLTFKLGWIKLSSAILWGLLSVVIVIIFRQKRRVG